MAGALFSSTIDPLLIHILYPLGIFLNFETKQKLPPACPKRANAKVTSHMGQHV